MKSGNKIIEQQDGWSLEEVTQWPVMASYHHQGWCVSKNKYTYDRYVRDGDFYVVRRPNDRLNRPFALLHITDTRFNLKRSGNESIEIEDLISESPSRVSEWFNDLNVAAKEIRKPQVKYFTAANTINLLANMQALSRAVNELRNIPIVTQTRTIQEMEAIQVYGNPVTQNGSSTVHVSDTAGQNLWISTDLQPSIKENSLKVRYNRILDRLKIETK